MLDKHDHDLLICIDVKLRELKTQFDNHLKHHAAITICALAAALSALATVLIFLTCGK
jgi:hypothetical protein